MGWLEGEVGEIHDREVGRASEHLQHSPVALCTCGYSNTEVAQ